MSERATASAEDRTRADLIKPTPEDEVALRLETKLTKMKINGLTSKEREYLKYIEEQFHEAFVALCARQHGLSEGDVRQLDAEEAEFLAKRIWRRARVTGALEAGLLVAIPSCFGMLGVLGALSGGAGIFESGVLGLLFSMLGLVIDAPLFLFTESWRFAWRFRQLRRLRTKTAAAETPARLTTKEGAS